MPTEIVEQLEAQVVAMQFSLCSKQKQMQDYFKSSPRAPTPTKEPRAPTPKMFPLRPWLMSQEMFLL